MRPFYAALAMMMLYGSSPAAASIRIVDSIYQDGILVVTGQTRPHARVTLDDKFVTQSDGGGHFEFRTPYKPETCMANITTDEAAYSAVITNCLLGDAAAATEGYGDARPTTTTTNAN